MNVKVAKDAQDLARDAAAAGAAEIRRAIEQRGTANVIFATGASQFDLLDALTADPKVDWSRVTGFHLDEYIGLSADHPASFRRYLKERLVDRVGIKKFHYVHGDAVDAAAECQRLGELIERYPIDVAFIGIGENGHLAFNDPPADFDTNSAYIVVNLDDDCRRQQLGEGWFATLDAVPKKAISMSIRNILASRTIICCVPDVRKAKAVAAAVQDPVSPNMPASILQGHARTTIYLDPPAASLLDDRSVDQTY